MLQPDARLHYNPDPGHLRRLLNAAEITRKEFALMCGVKRNTVARWFIGKIDIPYAAQFLLETLAVSCQESKASK